MSTLPLNTSSLHDALLSSSANIFAGVDVGSVATKVVLLHGLNHKILTTHIIPTGWAPQEAATEALAKACAKVGLTLHDINSVYGTGYGRIALPFAQKTVTEISCHAKAAHFMQAKASMVLDIGGQDSKAILLSPKGKVLDFVMNDKCAAGTGRFLQVLSGILNISLDEMNTLAQTGQAVSISSMCAVFAESEIIGLLAQKTKPNDIIAGVYISIAKRMKALSQKISNLSTDGVCVFTGGLSNNSAFINYLSQEIGKEIYVPEHAQHMGALGAALFAMENYHNESSA